MRFLFLIGLLLFPTFSYAAEPIQKIEVNVKQKKKMIEHFQKKILEHDAMSSKEQVLDDYRKTLTQTREDFKKNFPADFEKNHAAFDTWMKNTLELMAQVKDKDAITALEKAQLQELMSSGSYYFYFSRKYYHTDPTKDAGLIGMVIVVAVYMFLAVADVATLIFTIPISIFTPEGEPQYGDAPPPSPVAGEPFVNPPFEPDTLIQSLKTSRFPDEQKAISREYASHFQGRYVRMAEVKRIMSEGCHMTFEDCRVGVAEAFASHVIDPENSIQVAELFDFPHHKQYAIEVLGR